MTRTQVYLTARQHRALKKEAAREGVSMTELLRRILDQHLLGRAAARRPVRKELVLSFVGLGESGRTDTSRNHDRALDEALRAGMSRIRTLIEPQLAAAHAGTLVLAQYRELAVQVETEVGSIVANCKLEPRADAMLHLVIADILSGTDAMAGKNPKQDPARGLVKVAQAVDEYGSHFDHPGFTPVRNVH